MSKIYVVGIGPGEYEQMTIKAANALKNCDIIVGYRIFDYSNEAGSRAVQTVF